MPEIAIAHEQQANGQSSKLSRRSLPLPPPPPHDPALSSRLAAVLHNGSEAVVHGFSRNHEHHGGFRILKRSFPRRPKQSALGPQLQLAFWVAYGTHRRMKVATQVTQKPHSRAT